MAFSALVSVTTPTVAAWHTSVNLWYKAAVADPAHTELRLMMHRCRRRCPPTIRYQDEYDDARLDKHTACPISAHVNKVLMLSSKYTHSSLKSTGNNHCPQSWQSW